MGLAGLAAEPKPQGGALDPRVPVLQGRQPEGSVEPGVLVITNPDEVSKYTISHCLKHCCTEKREAMMEEGDTM